MSERFRNLVELCDRSCAKYADRALWGTRRDDGWVWTTYREFHELVARARGGLAALGVGPGDRVAILSENRVEWAVAAYATYGLEAAFVPMYPSQLAREWRFILDDCGAKVVLVGGAKALEGVRAMQPELGALEHVIGLDLPADDPRSWAALLALGDARPIEARSPDPGSIADFVYTSGTTGLPKGVLLSHGNLASNISAVHEVFTFEPDDRSLSFLPWAHAYGQTCEVHGLLSMGCSVAINDDLGRLLTNLAEVKPTILIAVPRIFNRIYEAVNRDLAHRPGVLRGLVRAGLRSAVKRTHGERLGAFERVELAIDEKLVFAKIRERFGGRLKYAISASATLGREVAEFVDALGLTVYEGYGLTETSPIVAANFPGHRRFGSVGHPLPGVRVVIDESVGDAPGTGEIVVYGPNVMVGYHRRPEENAKAFTPDGGLRTGDLGRLDEDGFLYVTGRIKEQYKLENGKYVMPSSLEETLKLSSFVANALVFGDGRPHNVALVVIAEEAVRAWAESASVELAADPTSDERVRALIGRELAARAEGFRAFERPRAFALLREDFTTANGLLTPTLKLKRREVVTRYQDVIESLYERPREVQASAP